MTRVSVAISALVLICSFGCNDSSSSPEATADTGGTPTDDKGKVIRMAHNDWLAANLNDEVAKIILEEKMGYKVEFETISTSKQWAKLATGELHVSLELWPAGHRDNIAKYIDTERTVENAGELGPIARKGLFVPEYVLTAHPEFRTYKGFQDPVAVKLFQTSDSGDKGRLLSGDPTWSKYYDKLIGGLGLQLVTTYAGDEALELAELQRAYERNQPILIYFWLPHYAFNKYNLTAVELPPYSDSLYADGKCDWPAERLTKIVNAGLNTYAPRAYSMLKAFGYTTAVQIKMMGRVSIDGKTVQETAREWVSENESAWKAWIPPAP
jgi:glycine betaine/proline transport system substrate-binding protein